MAKRGDIFKNLLMPKVDSNWFDLSHDVKLSFQMGELIPTCVMEALPGDVFQNSVQNMLRFAPLISPVMHKVDINTHYFFVPNRILWAEWEKWITGDSDVQAPYVDLSLEGGVAIGSLADYLGYPTGTYGDVSDIRASPMAMAAYLKIWDEYYRDQNLQAEQFDPLIPGNNETNYGKWREQDPLRRAWQHDYFTSCLPWAQKGDAVSIPLTQQDNIPIDYNNNGNAGVIRLANGNPAGGPAALGSGALPGSNMTVGGAGAVYDPDGTLVVDVNAGATDINTLRRAFRLQEWLEKNARGGTRYIENILAHFGIKSSDARLQRPEYIGGNHQNMIISEVLATAENADASIPVGQMAGHGLSVGGSPRWTYNVEEHGYIIGLISVRPKTAYQDGLHRSFTRFDRLEYAWPSFANIGEQPVKVKEIQVQTNGDDPETVFGYIPPYSEYKFQNSRVAGEMRQTLDFWHLGRKFPTGASALVLNEDFIKCVPSTRIFAVTDPNEDHIFAHVWNEVQCKRKLPKFGVPTI